MKQNIKYLFYFGFGLILIGLTSCQKNYVIGGKKEDVNKYKDISTYDVLNSMPQFDTLVQIIDASGLKDKINQDNTTFFAVNNQAVLSYLEMRTIILQNTVDQYAKFTLDSLINYVSKNINGTRDSLLMYLVSEKLTPENLTSAGKLYPSNLPGDTVIVSYEETKDPLLGYTDLVSTPPSLVYFAQLWGHYNLDENDSTAANIPSSTGVRVLIRTSFIMTKNGVINVLGSTPLFFFGTKTD